MAGIGFELQRLTRADALSANLGGLAFAVAVSSGPWLITCAALLLVQGLVAPLAGTATMERFSVLLVYNFALSLVVSGPVVLVVTRRISDAMHAHDAAEMAGLFITALTLLFGLVTLVGVPVHIWLVDWTPLERGIAVAGLYLSSGIWLVSAFLSALRSYRTIVAVFLLGMAAGVGVAWLLLPRLGPVAMLVGFNAGMGLIFLLLAARIFAEFPHARQPDWSLLGAFREFWQLALVGFAYNAAIWIDKVVMWFQPGAISPGRGMLSHPTYETAMFYAFLSVVPAMALFLISVETRAYHAYVRFYRDIAEHATLAEIHVNHRRFMRELQRALGRVAGTQVFMALLGLIAAPIIVHAVGAGDEIIPIFRFGLFGALFHCLMMLMSAMLAYLDLRRDLVVTSLIFLVLNGLLTWGAARLGTEYYGHGYAIAAVLSFAVAFVIVLQRVTRLPYLTFVSNNSAVRRPRRAVA